MLSVNPVTLQEAGAAAGPAPNFVWKYCRMCALEVKQGVYIFGEEGKRLQIPEKIRKTVAILVLEEDSLPKKICTSCCTSLEAYTQFKDSVVDAQEKLSAIAKSIEKSQEQSYLQLRNKQPLKSPKRSKVCHSSLASHSSCHLMFPTASVVSTVEPDLSEPTIECDEPPSSVASVSSEEDDNTTPKSATECISSNDVVHKSDESLQGALQGHSPPISVNKTPTREFKASLKSQTISESEDMSVKNVASKSPVYSSESSVENCQTEAYLVCGLCSSHFKDKDILVSHHNKSHSNDTQNDPLFGCSACPRISSNYEAIRQHIHGHRMTGMFKCPDCDKGFSTKDHLHVHITSKHNQAGIKLLNNQSCGKQPFSANNSFAERKKYPSCSGTSASTSESIQQTAESSYNKMSESPPCSSEELFTAATTESKDTGHSHSGSAVNFSASPIKTPEKYENVNAFVKVDLNSNSKSGSNADSQQEQVNQNEASNLSLNEEKDGYWKCDYCDKILRSKTGYDTHVATHKGRRFPCTECGVTYTQKSSLDHHTKVHHTNADKEFECPECSKRFKTFRQLGWHKKTHEKPLTDIRCPQCEKTFKNMVSFKTHMKLHRGSKKFACVQCPKAFYTKAKLQEHMNSHSGKRPFGCPVENCSKVFSCFSNYAKHFKKHHNSMLGPKGSMIPPPKMIESNNNVLPIKQNDIFHQKRFHAVCVKANQSVVTFSSQKETVIASTSTATVKSQETTQVTAAAQSHTASNEVYPQNNSIAGHPSFQIGTSVENPSTQTQTVLRPLPGIFSNSSSNNLGVQTSSASSQTFTPQNPCNSMPLLPSSNTGHSHSSLHTASTANENLSLAHTQSQSVPIGSIQSHSHHHVHHHPANVHAHNSAHSAHNNHAANNATQTHHSNQFQSQNHIQTVWQPVVLPNSKNYHTSASASLTTINSLELLDCAGTIHASESLTSNNSSNNNTNSNNSSNSNSHSHSQHQQSGVNMVPTSINAAHHATSHSSVVHAHHGVNLPNSGHSSNSHIGSSHHGSTTSTVPHSTTSSSGMPVSSSSNGVNIPTFGSLNQQSEPMELSYKDSNNFQEMPMELTKVFQRDPLELCVRQDFGHAQPLMDLSSRVVNVTVAGNPSMNVSTMSMNLNGNSSNTSNSTNTQSHYTSISSGTGSASTSILSVPYHKTVELVERELSLNDFTGAFRQPIDLISRADDQSHELCSEGNLVDLSLRSSFGQDQSASSFLRELIDLSSRSDSFHGEINLTNKQHQSSSNSHSQIHHHHSSGHHSISKPTSTGNPLSGHHHHHHTPHHHHNIQSHQSSGGSSSASAGPLQAVMYPDTGAMFNLQN